MTDQEYAVLTRDEATFRDLLAGVINRRPGARALTEYRLDRGGRVDIAVFMGDVLEWVIECKTSGYLHGIGQVIGYGLRARATPVLAVPGRGLPPELQTACDMAGVQLLRVAA